MLFRNTNLLLKHHIHYQNITGTMTRKCPSKAVHSGSTHYQNSKMQNHKSQQKHSFSQGKILSWELGSVSPWCLLELQLLPVKRSPPNSSGYSVKPAVSGQAAYCVSQTGSAAPAPSSPACVLSVNPFHVVRGRLSLSPPGAGERGKS